MAYNFGLFFGPGRPCLRIDAGERRHSVDRFLAGTAGALTGPQQQGLNESPGGSRCTPVSPGAGAVGGGRDDRVARRRHSIRDAIGFFRTGVSAIGDEPGTGRSGRVRRAAVSPPPPGNRANGASNRQDSATWN